MPVTRSVPGCSSPSAGGRWTVSLRKPLVRPVGRHQQAPLDPPGHRPAVALGLVLGRVEGQQRERLAEQAHLAALVGVDHPQDPQRHARQEAPVGAGQPLQVLGAPDPVQLGPGKGDLGLLLGGHAAVRRGLGLGDVQDLHPRASLTPAADALAWGRAVSRSARRYSRQQLGAYPLPGAPARPRPASISASAPAPSIDVSWCEPWGPVGVSSPAVGARPPAGSARSACGRARG